MLECLLIGLQVCCNVLELLPKDINVVMLAENLEKKHFIENIIC